MANKIRVLDDTVVNQIAAGEVVERPVSVVKELVENALDAGATEVTVVVGNGGKSLVEIIDNGCGMSKDDALLAVERFGTSKISSANDLQSINTFGFRGEALSSISSVAKCSLSTREEGRESSEGVEIFIQGGKLRSVEPRDLPQGTRISVRSLFYNIPARRKFLRAENTETALIKSVLVDFAVAYPGVRFSLVVDGSEVATYPAASSLSERVKQVPISLERPVSVDASIQTDSGVIGVVGVISQPIECVSSSGRLRLLINKRSVRDRLLLKAVSEGYGNFLRPGRYPVGILQITVPFQDVDVNVHPQKTEVRFRSPKVVFAAVADAVRVALESIAPEQLAPPQVETSNSGPWFSQSKSNFSFDERREATKVEFHSGSTEGTSPSGSQLGVGQSTEHLAMSSASGEVPASANVQELLPENDQIATELSLESLSSMRYVGQIFKLYLLFEGREQFVILDMHAAHERVRFYEIKKQYLAGGVRIQQLLIPETVVVMPEQISTLEGSFASLLKFGIDADRFEDDRIIVRGMPSVLGNISAKELITDLLSMPEWSDWESKVNERLDSVISRLACHGSVRSGRELKPQEVYELLGSLQEVETSAFCPHGRPVVKFIKEGEFELMFGRA